MGDENGIGQLLADLHGMSPAGFAVALHVTYTTPRYLFQSYDKAWMDLYSRRGYVLQDPTVRWGFSHTGTIRWSALAPEDPGGVLAAAASEGLRFGATVALESRGSRSIGSAARGDREYTDTEMVTLLSMLSRMHRATAETMKLSPKDHEMLRVMSIYLTHG